MFFCFCAANLLTLLVTVFITSRVAYSAYVALQPDWQILAEDAASIYDAGGVRALRPWVRGMELRGISATLLDGTRNLLATPPPQLAAHMRELVQDSLVVLHPSPGTTLVGARVDRPGRESFRLLAVRNSKPSPARLLLPITVQLVASSLVIAVVGWFIARGVSLPVTAVQQAARRLAEGELSSRVGLPASARGDELGQLARDFDVMAGRVQFSVEQTRGLLQDVSHELRSPLARLQLALEVARKEVGKIREEHLAQAQREIVRLNRVISHVLALARLEAQMPGTVFERVAIDELAAECIGNQQEAAATKGIVLKLQSDTLNLDADHDLLARALDNVLDNAIKFSPEGSIVEVRAHRAPGAVCVAVLDRGPGVPSDQLESIFRPFFRGANAARADGQGLGLAIVARIARAHRGSVSAADREGGGLAINLLLPTTGSASVL